MPLIGWPFKRQADTAEKCLELLHELHLHIDDARASDRLPEAEQILQHTVRVLRSHVEEARDG